MGLKGGTVVLTSGQPAFVAGAPVVHVFQVKTGRLRADSGFVLGPGQWVNPADLFTPHHPWGARAVVRTCLTAFPRDSFLLYLKSHPDLMAGFAARMAQALTLARQWGQIRGLSGAAARIEAALRLEGGGLRPVRPLTHWAEDLGLTHEALYRTLAKLEHAGRIRRLKDGGVQWVAETA